jgi:hypothetical protein
MSYKIKRAKAKAKRISQDTFNLKKGTILDFQGSWGSGIGFLIIKREDGKIERVSCDNAQTIRALDSAYGNVITAGHTASGKGYKGKKIYYGLESWGTLAGFLPVEEATTEIEEKYLSQFKGKKIPIETE